MERGEALDQRPAPDGHAPRGGGSAAAPEPRRLFNRNFVLLWQGQLVSQIGNQLHAIAMMFWIKHATGSATLMGTIMMVSMLPGVLLGPFGGTVADRFSRRKLIIFGDLLRGLLVLSLAGLMFHRPQATDLLVGWLFVVAVGMGILGALFRPAVSAAIPDLVPRRSVAAANSLNQSGFQLTTFIGQGLGGTLFRLLGAPVLFLIDGLTYVASGVTECFIRIPQAFPEAHAGLRDLLAKFAAETREGFHYAWRNRGLRDLFFAGALLNFLFAPLPVLLPFYVEDHLITSPGVHATPDWLGYLLAATGVGSLVGYALVGLARGSGRVRMVMSVVSLFVVDVILILAGATQRAPIALLLLFALGVGTGVINIGIITTMQITTPSAIRGRVFGLLGTLTTSLIPIGMGLAGVVADLVDHDIALLFRVCGVAAVVATLLIVLDRPFRDFLAYEPPRGESSASAGPTDDPA